MHVCQKETVWNEAGGRIVSFGQLQSRRGKNDKRHVNYVEDRKPVVHIFEYWTWAQALESAENIGLTVLAKRQRLPYLSPSAFPMLSMYDHGASPIVFRFQIYFKYQNRSESAELIP